MAKLGTSNERDSAGRRRYRNTYSNKWTTQGSPSWPCSAINVSLEAVNTENAQFVLSSLLGTAATDAEDMIRIALQIWPSEYVSQH